MATQTIVSGYIQSITKHNEVNKQYLDQLELSTSGHIKIVCQEIVGFGSSLFLLGGVLNLKSSEWLDYIKSLEPVLLKVKAFTVKINLENSDDEKLYSYEYINSSISENSVGGNWEKYLSKFNDDESELIEILNL